MWEALLFTDMVQRPSYCYGFMVNTDTLHVQDVFSARELKAKFGVECQTDPSIVASRTPARFVLLN